MLTTLGWGSGLGWLPRLEREARGVEGCMHVCTCAGRLFQTKLRDSSVNGCVVCQADGSVMVLKGSRDCVSEQSQMLLCVHNSTDLQESHSQGRT